MIEGQLTLPVLPGPALVAGPVFLCFELIGKPGHKGRHRSRIIIPRDAWTVVAGQRVLTQAGARRIFMTQYADPATEAIEKVIKQAAGLMMRGRPPSARPLSLLVHAFREIPKSWSARDKEKALNHAILPTGRPDGDNYLKAAQDALNGVAYIDDSQIIDARVIKRYSAKPAMRIELREMIDPPP